jgi:hypothetical protein
MAYHEDWCEVFDSRHPVCVCDAIGRFEEDPNPMPMPSAHALNAMLAATSQKV